MRSALRLYISGAAGLTVASGVWSAYHQPYDMALAPLLFFIALVFLAESFCIDLPKAGAISITFTIILAAIVLFGPGLAAASSLFAAVVWRDLKKGTSPMRWIFNGSQYALSALAGGWAYSITGGVVLSAAERGFTLSDFPHALVPTSFAVVAFFLANTVLVSIAIGLSEGMRPLDVWLVNVRWAIPNYFALAPLGLAIAHIFMVAGYVGVVLIFLPLIVARQTFHIYMSLRATYMGTIQSLIAALEAKDPYTRGHSERVSALAEATGQALKLGEEDLETLRYAGILHDIGKIGTARYILRKPGKLSADEIQRIRLHPEAGALILAEVSFLNKVVPIIFHHHERYDGTGYTDGIAGDEIPLLARILTIADAYDAMTSPRPYRRHRLTKEDACLEILRCGGTQFDPKIIPAFLRTIDYESEKSTVSEGQLTLMGVGNEIKV